MTQCKNNLHQIGLAGLAGLADSQQYGDNLNIYAPVIGFGGSFLDKIERCNADKNTVIPVFLCPSDGGSRIIEKTLISIVSQRARTNFAGILGDGKSKGPFSIHYFPPIGFWPTPRLRSHPIQDGMSNTFNIGEQDSVPDDPEGTWHDLPAASCEFPPNAKHDNGHKRADSFRSAHRGGAHFLMCDGSVYFISGSISLEVYHALSTVSGGEVVGEF